MDSFIVISVPVLTFLLWIYMSYMVKTLPTVTGKRILLLIAHPDDEAMFFAPTVLGLIRPENGNQLKILCLSSGNADGLGEIRKKELLKSVTVLGLQPTDVIIVDDPNLQDGAEQWNAQYISRILLSNLAPNLSKTSSSKPPTTLVDTIITFDERGVSQHPNHAACYRGADAFLTELMRGRDGWESPVAVYVLQSISLMRKYAHIADSILTFVFCVRRILSQRKRHGTVFARQGGARDQTQAWRKNPTSLIFVNGILDWSTAQRAMVSGHWSQMVWFRWGWIGLGRYLVINDLIKLKAS